MDKQLSASIVVAYFLYEGFVRIGARCNLAATAT